MEKQNLSLESRMASEIEKKFEIGLESSMEKPTLTLESFQNRKATSKTKYHTIVIDRKSVKSKIWSQIKS